mgnify:CR=1 FL=1
MFSAFANSPEPATFGDGRAVTCAMDYAHDHDGISESAIIDGIVAVEGDTQAGRQLLARGTGQGKMAQRFEMRLQCD